MTQIQQYQHYQNSMTLSKQDDPVRAGPVRSKKQIRDKKSGPVRSKNNSGTKNPVRSGPTLFFFTFFEGLQASGGSSFFFS